MKLRAILLIILALTLATFVNAGAKDKGERGNGGGRSSADVAAEQARRDTGGRVLSVQPSPQQGQGDYRVKILTPQGEVRYMNVDPRQEQKGQR
jgi:uncharacterized membrane protein YkoI